MITLTFKAKQTHVWLGSPACRLARCPLFRLGEKQLQPHSRAQWGGVPERRETHRAVSEGLGREEQRVRGRGCGDSLGSTCRHWSDSGRGREWYGAGVRLAGGVFVQRVAQCEAQTLISVSKMPKVRGRAHLMYARLCHEALVIPARWGLAGR